MVGWEGNRCEVVASKAARGDKRVAKKQEHFTDREGTGQGYALMQTVLDNMGEGVALFDRDFRLRFINRQ